MAQSRRKIKRVDRSGNVRERDDTYEDPNESRVNRGLADLAKKVEKQAEGVEESEPDDKDMDETPKTETTPTPTPAPSKPSRSSFPSGLAGEAAYQRAVREWTRKKNR